MPIKTEDLPSLISSLIDTEEGGRTMLAAKLGASSSSLTRWISGKSRPHPDVERSIRALAAKRGLTTEYPLFPEHDHGTESDIRAALVAALRQVRELMHSKGRLSSRHEALDEIAKLLFAHVMSIDTGGSGIGLSLLDGEKEAAIALKSFVRDSFRQYLPSSLSHELKLEDFELRLKESENELASGLIKCLAALSTSSAVTQFRDMGKIDLLNDTFGQFLTDSFTDEKELGQYLTPPEVVRFMVELGLQSLLPEHLQMLLSNDTEDSAFVLDPSCGVGSFLAEATRALLRILRSNGNQDRMTKWIRNALGNRILGVDKSERMIHLALTNLALFGAQTVNLHLLNGLSRTGRDGNILDSLVGKAALILTNPPFGASFDRREMSKFRIANHLSSGSASTIDSELLFLERYLDWLMPGGVLVAVVPDSILTNQGLFAKLREGIASQVELISVVSLPPVTFAAAGTSTKTSIIHLRKRSKPRTETSNVYFAICESVGFEVNTRGSLRARVPNGENQLSEILVEATSKSDEKMRLGCRVQFSTLSNRWDARYNTGLPNKFRKRIEHPRKSDILVADVSELVNERINPVRFGEGNFKYIEISDIDGTSNVITAKSIPCNEAPSRARKLVAAGDVLISTVRPERKAIGVVPIDLDGAVCSTGIAVLRPKKIPSLVLARLLQSDFVNAQLLRNNIGIAYPTIDESCLPSIVLPATGKSIEACQSIAESVARKRKELFEEECRFDHQVAGAIASWMEN